MHEATSTSIYSKISSIISLIPLFPKHEVPLILIYAAISCIKIFLYYPGI